MTKKIDKNRKEDMSKNHNSINVVSSDEAVKNIETRNQRTDALRQDVGAAAHLGLMLMSEDEQKALMNPSDNKRIDFTTHISAEANEKRALDQAANEANAQAEYAQAVETSPFGSHEDYEYRQATRADRYDGTPNLNEDEEKTVQVISGEATDYE